MCFRVKVTDNGRASHIFAQSRQVCAVVERQSLRQTIKLAKYDINRPKTGLLLNQLLVDDIFVQLPNVSPKYI